MVDKRFYLTSLDFCDKFRKLTKGKNKMGNLHAREMAEMLADNLEQAIEWHLTSNHFPPIPKTMVEPCVKAIEFANAGEWDKLIPLPEGVGYKGLTVAPVSAIVSNHHLEAWITDEEL